MLRKSNRVQGRAAVYKRIKALSLAVGGLSPLGLAGATAGAFLFAVGLPPGLAASATWDGGPAGTGTDLNTGANWSTDAVPNASGDIATWDGIVPGPLTLSWVGTFGPGFGSVGTNVNVTANQTSSLLIGSSSANTGPNVDLFNIGNLTIASGAGAFTFGDGVGVDHMALRASGATTFTNNSSNTATIASNVVYASGGGGDRVLAFDGSGNWLVSSGLFFNNNGSFPNMSLVKSGTGTMTLTGLSTSSGANAGTVSISGGVLQLGDGTTGRDGTIQNGAVTIAAGASLIFNRFGSSSATNLITGAGSIVKNGAGTQTLSGASNFTGGTTLNGGVLTVGSSGALGSTGSIVFGGGALQYSASNTTDYSARITPNVSTGAVAIDTNGQNVAFATGLTASQSGGLTKLGAGALTLNAANAHTGATTVTGGTLKLGSGANISASAVTVGASGKLGTAFSGNGQSVTLGSSLSQTNGGGIDLRDGFVGTLNVSNGLTLNGGTMGFDIGATGDTLALTGGTYSASNSNVITLANLGSVNTGGTYNLITGATGISTSNFSISNPTFVVGFNASLQTAGNALRLIFTSSSTSPTAYWNVNGAANFTSASFSLNADGSGVVAGIDGGTDVTFSSTPVAGANAKTATLTATQDVKSLAVNDPSAVTITGGATLNVLTAGGITVNGGAGSLTISATEVNLTASQTWTNNSTNDAKVTSVVSGSGTSLTVGGTGRFVLTAANTYSGATTINTGATLQLGDGTAGHDGTIATTSGVIDNGTLAFNRFASSTSVDAISGTGNVATIGTATLTMGNANNSYTGATVINAGTLSVSVLASGGANSNIGASSNAASNLVINGGTLLYTGVGVTTDRNFTIGNGNATIDGSGSAALTLNGNGSSIVAFSTPNAARTLTLTGNFAAATDGTFGNTNLLAGIITDNGSGATSLIKNGTGYWRLDGANTFTGGVTLNTGGLEYNYGSGNTPLGSGTLTINGGIMSARIVDAPINTPVVIGGNFTIGLNDGATGVATSYSGAVDLGTAVRTITVRDNIINTDAVRTADAVFSGVISNTGGINKAGLGTLRLSGANTYSGTTTLAAGILQVNNTNALQNSTLVMSAGTLAFGDTPSTTFSTATFGGLSGSAAISLQNINSSPAPVALSVGNNNANTSYSGTISGSGSLTKIGTGSLALSGSNTYTGTTTVSAGKLQLTNVAGSATGTGPVALSGGNTATVGGTGSASGAVTATNGTRIAPALNTADGDGSGRTNFGVVGTITLGSGGGLTLTSANLDYDLAATAAAASDKILTGFIALDADSSPVVFNFAGSTLGTTAAYTLIDASSTTAVSGNLANLSANFLGGLSGHYSAVFATGGGGVAGGGDNEDLVVTFSAVPEPTSLGLLGLVGIGLLRRRRAALSPSR